MVRKRMNKIIKGSATVENPPIETKLEIKSEDLVDMEDNKNDLKSIKKDLKSKKPSKVNNSRYFNRSKSKDGSKKERGVVYIKCLPHGFYEKQLEGYFGQFGKVTGVYVPKSRKTGRAKGFGFVEFLHPEVAEIAADTMNNYLMFNRLIKTEVVPPEKQRPMMFSERYKNIKAQRSHSKLKERADKRHKLICTKHENFVKKATNQVKRLHKSLTTLGVDYKFKVVGALDPVKLTGIKSIDPDQTSPKGTSTSPPIKSPIKKKTNKNKPMKGSCGELPSSSSEGNIVNKLKVGRKRLGKIMESATVKENSVVKVKRNIKSEDLSCKESPAKKKKKTSQNKQNESSANQDNKVNRLKMVRERLRGNKAKKESSTDDKGSPVKVKQEIKVKNKKKTELQDNKNNIKSLKKDFKSKKTPKVNNLRSLSGKLKSKVASKKMAKSNS